MIPQNLKDALSKVQQWIKQSSIIRPDAMLGKIERVLIEKKLSDKDPCIGGAADNTRLVIYQ